MTDATQPGGYEVNQRLALMCVDDANRKTVAGAALQELGYRVHVPADVADGLDRLRRRPYDVVVVDEEFQGSASHDHPLLRAIQLSPMSQRRSTLVALLGRSFTTFDNMTAFAKSVNVVVDVRDIEHFKAIVERALADNDDFYRVFRQVIQDAGKR